MQLTYRGISYNAPETIEVSSLETVQGRYHGLAIQIPVPRVSERMDELLSQMIYRGIQLATH